MSMRPDWSCLRGGVLRLASGVGWLVYSGAVGEGVEPLNGPRLRPIPSIAVAMIGSGLQATETPQIKVF